VALAPCQESVIFYDLVGVGKARIALAVGRLAM
jgi:hypothetical protein